MVGRYFFLRAFAFFAFFLRFAMVRLFLELFARDFTRAAFFEEDFFFAAGLVEVDCVEGIDAEAGAGFIAVEVCPADVASDDSRGLIPNMPTIGLVRLLVSDFDIRASESSRRGQHRATIVKLPTEKTRHAFQQGLNHERHDCIVHALHRKMHDEEFQTRKHARVGTRKSHFCSTLYTMRTEFR